MDRSLKAAGRSFSNKKKVIKKEDIPINDLKKQNAFSNEIIAK